MKKGFIGFLTGPILQCSLNFRTWNYFGISEVGLPKGRSLVLLAQMSSAKIINTDEYTKKNVQYALQYSDFVGGFISQNQLINFPYLLHFTPGVANRIVS